MTKATNLQSRAGITMKSKQLAACSILCALAVVILTLGAMIGIGTYAGPLLAIWVMTPVLEKYGSKAALMCWVVTSVLALIIVADKELVLVYIGFGWYPVLKKKLDKLPKLPRLLLKLLVYLIVFAAVLALVVYVLGMTELLEEALWVNLSFLAVGALVFLAADFMLDRTSAFLLSKIRKLM